MPSSRAISAIGRPLLQTSSTASRLNSAVNWRRFLGCLSSMRTSSAQGRCPASGGKSNQSTGEAWLAASAAARAREARRIAREELRTMTVTLNGRSKAGVLDRLLTVEEAAERLGTSTRFVRRLIFERRIAFVKMGRHVRITPGDLDAYVAAGRVDVLRRRVEAG